MEKGPRPVTASLDVLSLENRGLALLPDWQPLNKSPGYPSVHSHMCSLKSQCLARISDLMTMGQPEGRVAGCPDVLSLENRCLSTLRSVKTSVSPGPSRQCLQLPPPMRANASSLYTSTGLLSEAPGSRRAQRLSAAETVQDHLCCSKEEKKSVLKEGEGAQMPFYSLSLGEEEEEEEELNPQLSSEDMDSHPYSSDKYLQENKMILLSRLCSTMVSDVNKKNAADISKSILEVCEIIAPLEPEFILKASLYARQQLNLRDVANMVLAVAADLPACRPHLRRYFCAIVHLPSDWIQVAEFYQELAKTEENKLAPLPACLRAAMTDKFAQFDEYQLAKYNLRRHRAKSRPCRPLQPPVSLWLPLLFTPGPRPLLRKGETGAWWSREFCTKHLMCSPARS